VSKLTESPFPTGQLGSCDYYSVFLTETAAFRFVFIHSFMVEITALPVWQTACCSFTRKEFVWTL